MYKFFLSHIVIICISILLSFSNNANIGALIFLILLIALCYFVSGYIFTRTKIPTYKYFIVSFVGILLWLTGFISSPECTLWKVCSGAHLWLFFQLYIYPEYLVRSFNLNNYSLGLDLIIKFIFPFIFSSLQFLGGITKIRNKTTANSQWP